tara:strand:+ start:94 stop:525 length:432 start_codon:yes stop_codon:yes gene_type:complete
MVDVMKAELMQRIKEHEGYRLDPYHCTEGFLTGGYGHKILQGEEVPTTKEGWDNLFEKDFNKAWDSMERLCAEHGLDIPNKAKGILCEMIFQMGFAGVSKFKMMIAALQQNNFIEAGRQMLDSRWAKQTPNRAQALSKQMEEV